MCISDAELVARIDRIEQAVHKLTELVESRVTPECERMGTHITFVEDVYAKIQMPLKAFCNVGLGAIRYLSVPQLPPDEKSLHCSSPKELLPVEEVD